MAIFRNVAKDILVHLNTRSVINAIEGDSDWVAVYNAGYHYTIKNVEDRDDYDTVDVMSKDDFLRLYKELDIQNEVTEYFNII